MKKNFDEFVRLPLGKMSEKISEMTYLFNNTVVPKTHYKKILEQTLIETISTDTTIQVALLSAVLKALQSLEKESNLLFMKALICMEKGIKVDDMDARTYYALEETIKANSNKKYKMLNQQIIETYEYFYEQGLPIYVEGENDKLC